MRMISRATDVETALVALKRYPVVAILGPRQVGKTTLARLVARKLGVPVTLFDLERDRDLRRLDDAETALQPLRGLVVLDEIQRRPELFPLLRVLADRRPVRTRFLILGSASPHLLRQSSESLAGRIRYLELDGLGLSDVGEPRWPQLWLRGGFPLAFVARTTSASFDWREGLVRTYLERDIPELGLSLPAATLRRFWTMVAHYHGQRWNSAEFARAFGLSEMTIRRYLDLLRDTFMVRALAPWAENLGKRVVKAPKVYVKDTGLLHTLLSIRAWDDLLSHPKVGASFEGFALGEVIRRLGADDRECHFWATYQGAELDLLVVRGRRRLGFEFKHTAAPGVTKSMKIAADDLKLDRLDVVHIGKDTYPLSRGIRAVSIGRLQEDLEPLS